MQTKSNVPHCLVKTMNITFPWTGEKKEWHKQKRKTQERECMYKTSKLLHLHSQNATKKWINILISKLVKKSSLLYFNFKKTISK